jgi:hypothetical protein
MASLLKFASVTLCVAATCATMRGQASPTAAAPDPYSAFALPTVGGSLRYSLTASETVLTGYNGTTGDGANTYTNLSGDVAYLSNSQRHPFSAVYAGGYLIGTSSFPSYAYQSLTLSQELHLRDWDFIVSDSVSYLPQTPIGSLSGIPGAGDLSLTAVQISTNPGLDILTTYATRVSNQVSGTVTRRFTPSTSLSLTGSDFIQRYTGSSTGNQGIDNDQQNGGATLQHRLDERTSIGGGYQFTNSSFRSSYLGPGDFGFQTHYAQFFVTRQVSRNLSFAAGAGPQWAVPGSDGGITTGTSLSVAVNASLNYTAKKFTSSIGYVRGINNGNGVTIGARQDSVVASISRGFARIYNVGGIVGYNHSEQLGNSLLPAYNSSGVIAGGQLSAQVRQPLSVFVSYTVQRQLFNGYAPAGIAFNGLTQYATFGVTYSPKPFFHRN